ncbi:hypothetical protein F2P81_010316 [Scophthalmus maximus]|uniref:Phosphoglucomutase-2 n=1 Tax=Scophthalmus maximus TaxID=52904 RepID=A0A6A4T5H3_SCOMX|nr:hypothetical protein F2P81_010316 [Scophthalmus maximus]
MRANQRQGAASWGGVIKLDSTTAFSVPDCKGFRVNPGHSPQTKGHFLDSGRRRGTRTRTRRRRRTRMDNGSFSTGDTELDQAVEQWLQYDKNLKTASMVRDLVKEGAVEALKKCFSSRMEFGTAGLRAAMGPGTSCMNELTIIQTTQGFCCYLEDSFENLKEQGVVIGYDARAHPPSGGSSKLFASLAAAVFISRGVPVHLFSDITPTPFVPFTVSHLGLCAGIMVTASHNPKQDNGYKVYWENGAQIVSPHDKGISKAIEENLEPWPQSWNAEEALKSPLLKDPYQEIHTQYFKAIQKHCHHRDINKSSEVKIVHTSVHGVGHTFVQSAFKAFDLHPPYAVEEQKDPDPEFPTVKYPNPEEGEGVLTLSFALAEREGASVVLANDPDADRLAMAEKQERYGYHISKNSYFICHDQDVIRTLFERLRNHGGQKDSYPVECGRFAISNVRDLTTGYDDNQPDKKAVLPTSSSSQMVTFTFSNGGVATMRTSGTEPKIKYYTELCAAPGNSDVAHLRKELDDLVDAIIENFFEPKKNKLQPKPE